MSCNHAGFTGSILRTDRAEERKSSPAPSRPCKAKAARHRDKNSSAIGDNAPYRTSHTERGAPAGAFSGMAVHWENPTAEMPSPDRQGLEWFRGPAIAPEY